MENDFTVKIDYRNKDLEKINERVYTFQQYVDMTKLELMRVIMDVEDIFYKKFGSKEEWDDDASASFQKIRHKLLDQANAIERLPNTLRYKGVSCSARNLSEILAEIINNK